MSIPWLVEKKELKNESKRTCRGSHERSQTYFGARAKSLKNAYVKSKLNGLGNDPNNQNYGCREEYWMVHEVSSGFGKLMHRKQSKLYGPGYDQMD